MIYTIHKLHTDKIKQPNCATKTEKERKERGREETKQKTYNG